MKNVYYININNFDMDKVNYRLLLPEDRKIRVEKALSKEKAKQICMAGLLVRYCLKKYGINPDYITKAKHSSTGKPYFQHLNFNFNLSHSGTIVCIITSDESEVGIDVQIVKKNIAYAMKDFFCEEDISANEIIDDVKGTFLWSKKEAFLKCIGTGWNQKAYKGLSVKNECVIYNNSIYYFKTKQINHSIMTVCGIVELDDLTFIELEVSEFEK